MRKPFFKSFLFILALTFIPSRFAAAGMISTREAADEITRAQNIEKIEGYLERDDVRKQLEGYGVSSEEISARLATLSDTEIQQMGKQIQQSKAGGEVIYIGLGTILLVIIILLLIRRI